MNFTVGLANPGQFGLKNYSVKREGDNISIQPPDNGRRSGRDGFTLQVQSDQIHVYAPNREYRVKMNEEGVTVDDPAEDGLRSGGYDMVLNTPLAPDQFKSAGLSVAFSVIGFPLPAHLLGAL